MFNCFIRIVTGQSTWRVNIVAVLRPVVVHGWQQGQPATLRSSPAPLGLRNSPCIAARALHNNHQFQQTPVAPLNNRR